MPDSTARAQFERTLTRELSSLLNSTRTRFMNRLYHTGFQQGELANIPQDEMQAFRNDLMRVLQPKMVELYIETVQDYAGMTQWFIDSAKLAEMANTWGNESVPLLVDQLISTTEDNLRLVAQRAPDLELNKDALGLLLGGIGLFGITRAIMIAQDQATRARTAAEDGYNQQIQDDGTIRSIEEVWYTRKDERVCFQCRPLHGKPKGDGWTKPPPLHPRCRCERKFRITTYDGQVFIVHSREEIDEGKTPVTIGR